MGSQDDSVRFGEVMTLVERLRKEGPLEAMGRLTEIEPVVAPYAAAAATKLVEYVQKLGLDERACRTVLREAVLMQMVCIEGMRLGHLKLWQDELPSMGDASSEGGNHG